jgi:hypothetical protein
MADRAVRQAASWNNEYRPMLATLTTMNVQPRTTSNPHRSKLRMLSGHRWRGAEGGGHAARMTGLPQLRRRRRGFRHDW